MKITKAILTGGGRATRLRPMTSTINKHLLPLANKPMILHAIEKVVEAGVTDIFINTNPGDTSLADVVGDGRRFGVRITYFEQTGGPQGIAHVVNEAQRFIGHDPFMFYLSDNILLGAVKDMVHEFAAGSYDCMLAFARVPDPERFGVPVFDENDKLISVVEKPQTPASDFAVTGIYLYGPDVFFDAYERIRPSPRGEYEISDIHDLFLREGKHVGYKEITGWWKDTGKPNDLLLANKLILDGMAPPLFTRAGTIDTTAVITGSVSIGAGSVIGPGVALEGPVIIGENCALSHATIGPHVTIGNGTTIMRASIHHTIVLEDAVIDCPIHITESLIGKRVRLQEHPENKKGEYRMIVGDNTALTWG